MKKFILSAVLVLFLVSCNSDDETLIPQCTIPVNISEEQITDMSADLQWDDSEAASYKVEYGLSGFSLGTGTMVTSTTSSFTLSNLIANTSYDYYVQAICTTNNASLYSALNSFTTAPPPVVTEFRTNLSELNLFSGNLGDLIATPYAFEYNLNTTLFSDYAYKYRLIALPNGTTLSSNGDGLPNFPDNTVIAKTFYYNIDERDASLGRNLVETRVIIKMNGVWEFGNYIWNEDQSDAILDYEGLVKPISWINAEGVAQNINYEIPSVENCFTCHQSYGNSTPIGPKLRSMNFDIDGVNQLQKLIANGQLTNLTDISTIRILPNWKDTSVSEEIRVRSYFDMNCAHCHSAGGFHTVNYYDALNVAYETSFDDSHIFDKRYNIIARIQTSIDGYSMPYLGVTSPHQEALDLIIPYLESLE